MFTNRSLSCAIRYSLCVSLLTAFSACIPEVASIKPSSNIPEDFNGSEKTTRNSVSLPWQEYFSDPHITTLVEAALKNNQEMNIFMQEMEIAKNEIIARRGAYLPFLELDSGVGVDKVGKYTRLGALEENNDIEPGKSFPDPLTDYKLGLHASWELDIWGKLRDAEKSAITRFLATSEGKNFLVTNLVAEIANTYFELLALDNQLQIINQNLDIQDNALHIVKLKKEAAKVTELAIRRFEAQLFKTRSLKYDIQQKVIETENKLNFLIGRYPQPILRNPQEFYAILPRVIQVGLPSQLLENRPDVKQAELEMKAAELDVDVARARFYPSLRLSGDVGYQAYRFGKVLESPESLLYSIGAGLTGPILNRTEIETFYLNANAKQSQAVINYERVLLKAYLEVVNQLAKIDNTQNSYLNKSNEVQALNDSVDISNTLFNAARADYMEVLLTQRDVLEAKVDLVDTKLEQLRSIVNVYRALGGGWQETVESGKKAP